MKALFLWLLTFNSFILLSQNPHPLLNFEVVHSGFSAPIDIAHAGDGSNRLFIAEKAGIIKIIDNGVTLPTPFMNISDKVSTNGERGLLGIAFHPDYSNNGFLFVHYSNSFGDSQISRLTVDTNNSNKIDTSTEESIILIDQPFSNHNGGSIKFAPDGYLYIAIGDGGSGGDPGDRAQNPQLLLGKILRLDVDNGLPYSIPVDNPFIDSSGILDEIWAIGLRNPFRFSFDSQTGDMWIGDVGQNAWEEVNFQPTNSTGGENYGWRCYEGNHPFNLTNCGPMTNYVDAIYEYPHVAGGRSITGGAVYRGANPCLQGIYICADYVRRTIHTVRPDGIGGWTTSVQSPGIGSLAAFGEDEDHNLYAVSIGNGVIYKIEAADITLIQDPIQSGIYNSAATLTVDGTINQDSMVTVIAKDGVLLESQMEVERGGILEGKVGCNE